MHLPPGVGPYFRNVLDSPEFTDAELSPQYDLLCDRVFLVLARQSRCRVFLLEQLERYGTNCIGQIALRLRSGSAPEAFKSAALLEWCTHEGEIDLPRARNLIDQIASEVTVERRIILILHHPERLAQIIDPDFGNLLNRFTVRSRLNYPLSFIGVTTLDEYRKYIEIHSSLERNNQPISIEALL
jgi:hypothetical protein